MHLIKITRMKVASYLPSDERIVEARETKTRYVVDSIMSTYGHPLEISKMTRREVGATRGSHLYYYGWHLVEVLP